MNKDRQLNWDPGAEIIITSAQESSLLDFLSKI